MLNDLLLKGYLEKIGNHHREIQATGLALREHLHFAPDSLR